VITVSHRNLVIGQNNLLIIGYSVSLLWENAMKNQERKATSCSQGVLELIVLLMFCNTAAAIDSSVQSNTTTMPNTECLLNWAQTFYPSLFSPALQEVQSDNHFYYQGPTDFSPRDMGDLSVFLKESGCGALAYPVIFIHGLASSAETWAAFRDYLINNAK
jgi:hypothetical protein